MNEQRDYKENCCEIELENDKELFFFKIFFNPTEIWVDTLLLPKTAFLCAACDGIASLVSQCGEKADIQRHFLPIEWVINDWGGDEELVEAIKKRKQMILNDIDNLKAKHGIE